MTGENVAEKYGITREEQDEFAVNSHRKAVSAIKECRFKAQIVPVEIPAKKKGSRPVIFDKDEGPREDTTIEDLARAEAGIQERWDRDRRQCSRRERRSGGCGGDQCGRAKELGAQPMVRIVAQATSGIDPKWVMMAPVGAVRNLGKDRLEERRSRSLRTE